MRIPVLSAPTPLDAYVIHTKVRESIGHRAPVVGQREIFGGTYKPRHPSAGLTISQTPLDERVYGDDTRLFRVTDIRGLRRGSFRPPNWPTTGHCDSYLVAEELPLHVAFGPHGTQVLELVELAESLTVDDVVVTGERAIALGHGDVRHIDWRAAGQVRLHNAFHEVCRRVNDHVQALVLREHVPDVLEWRDGCSPWMEIVHPTWVAAEAIIRDSIAAVLFADAFDAASIETLGSDWPA